MRRTIVLATLLVAAVTTSPAHAAESVTASVDLVTFSSFGSSNQVAFAASCSAVAGSPTMIAFTEVTCTAQNASGSFSTYQSTPMSAVSVVPIQGSSGTLPFDICATGRATYNNGNVVVDGPNCVTFRTACLALVYTSDGTFFCSNAAARPTARRTT